MDKEELLAYLLAKPQIVSLGEATITETTLGFNKYVVSAVVSTSQGAMTVQNIGFYENIATSECLFMNAEPFVERDPTFIQKVISKIGDLMTASTIKAGFTGAVDPINKTVIVNVVMPDNSTVDILVFEKPDESLDYNTLI